MTPYEAAPDPGDTTSGTVATERAGQPISTVRPLTSTVGQAV
ncbi:hypothetical protein ACFW6N_32835 [Streptomyces cyaneofuscatus]|nr:hypothetical protein [Streptomyces sp. RM72]